MSNYVKLDKVYNGIAQPVEQWAQLSLIAKTVNNYRGMIRPGATVVLRWMVDGQGQPLGFAYAGEARSNPEYVLTLRG